jgi:hypothetical protein
LSKSPPTHKKFPFYNAGLIYHKLAKISPLSITFIPAASNKLRIIKTPLFQGGLKAENQLDSPYIEEPKPA